MEENAANNLTTYIIDVPVAEEASLGAIRHWKNLSVAFDGNLVWIKGFTREQAFSPELRQIPFADLFEQKQGLLFKPGRLVPERKMRTGLLWNPVQRAFPVATGTINHNFFGLHGKIKVRIISTENEQPATALLSRLSVAEKYITETASARLAVLTWCILNDQAFFIGNPLLSIPGMAYWARGSHFIPAGFDFEFPLLAKHIESRLDPENTNKILWFANSSYVLLPKKMLMPLSISSFRLSIK